DDPALAGRPRDARVHDRGLPVGSARHTGGDRGHGALSEFLAGELRHGRRLRGRRRTDRHLGPDGSREHDADPEQARSHGTRERPPAPSVARHRVGRRRPRRWRPRVREAPGKSRHPGLHRARSPARALRPPGCHDHYHHWVMTKRSAGQLRRQQILDEAQQLFNRQGFRETNLDDVAVRLGIKRQAIYYYFKSKEDVLWELVELASSTLTASAAAIFEADLDPEAKLASLVDNHVRQLLSDPEIFRLDV